MLTSRHENTRGRQESTSRGDFKTRHNLWSPAVKLISRRHDWLQSFPFQQFHVLFNSLFKILFIFPSRYLFAIGLSPIFSLRWYLPPVWSCNPKQLNSLKAYRRWTTRPATNRIITLYNILFQKTSTGSEPKKTLLQITTRPCEQGGFKIWALPSSLTITRGILVSFFSSTY